MLGNLTFYRKKKTETKSKAEANTSVYLTCVVTHVITCVVESRRQEINQQ
jgi:hypothetical protein